MQKNLIVRQDGYKECGSAALLSIIRYYKGDISINRLVEMTNTTKNGTSFYNLKVAAQELGLEALGYKVDDVTLLYKINHPFICQFKNDTFHHFVVVYKINENKVTIMDPACGKVNLSILDFTLKWTGYIMLFEAKKKLPIYKSSKYLNEIIIKSISSNRDVIINIVILSSLYTIFTCISALYLQISLDKVLTTNYHNLVIITLIFILINLVKDFSNYYRNSLLIYLNANLDLSLIVNTFSKVILLPFSYYKNKTTGEVISRINDLSYIKNMLSQIIITVFLDIGVAIVVGILLFMINKEMFFVLIILTLIYLVIMLVFKPFFKKMTNINQENSAKVSSLLVELISSFETIKALNIEKKMQVKMKKLYLNFIDNMVSYDKMVNLENILKELGTSLTTLLLYFIGIKNIMAEKISIGNFLTFTFLLNYYLQPIKNIMSLNKSYHYATNTLKRANNLLEIESDNLEESTNLEFSGNIEFKNLSFGYSPIKSILKNISFKIEDKEKVLILGNSGSGKSTLFKLLYGYYQPKASEIYINGYDILDYKIKNIRENIAYISQNEMLYTDTIYNNITLQRNIEKKEYLEICDLTYVSEIVNDNLLRHDTLLEENATNLSGGQRQRIILARALLKTSKILLIDEGLNELDINLERKILKNIFHKYQDKTIIIISHRLENMDLYDKVIKLEDGYLKAVIKRSKIYDL